MIHRCPRCLMVSLPSVWSPELRICIAHGPHATQRDFLADVLSPMLDRMASAARAATAEHVRAIEGRTFLALDEVDWTTYASCSAP